MKTSQAALIAAALIVSACAQVVNEADAPWSNASIGKWVLPGIFVGIFLMIFILLTFCIGTYQLMAIQTPVAFAEKNPDWGKVEEVE